MAPSADALSLLLAGSPWVQILFEVAAGGELVGVVATRAAYRALLLVDDVRGRSIAEALRPDSARSVSDGYRDSLQLGEPVSNEIFAATRDGEAWGVMTLTPLFDRGVPAYVLASFLELDFVQRTEAALARIEASLRALIDAASDAILVVANERVTSANAAAAKRLGPDLVGRAVADVVRDVDPIVVPLPDETKLLVLPVSAASTERRPC